MKDNEKTINGFLTVGGLIEKLKSFDPRKPVSAIWTARETFDVYDVFEDQGDIYIDLNRANSEI